VTKKDKYHLVVKTTLSFLACKGKGLSCSAVRYGARQKKSQIETMLETYKERMKVLTPRKIIIILSYQQVNIIILWWRSISPWSQAFIVHLESKISLFFLQ